MDPSDEVDEIELKDLEEEETEEEESKSWKKLAIIITIFGFIIISCIAIILGCIASLFNVAIIYQSLHSLPTPYKIIISRIEFKKIISEFVTTFKTLKAFIR